MSRLRRPSSRFCGVGVLTLVLLPGIVAAQPGIEQAQSLSMATRAVTSAVVTLLAGGAYFGFAPDSAEQTMERAKAAPVESFMWGLGIGILVILVSVLLAVTGIGLIIAIPLLLVFAVAELAAQSVVFVLIVGSLVDSKPPVGRALVAAAVVAGVLSAIPVLGWLVSFVVGSVGLGALVHQLRG